MVGGCLVGLWSASGVYLVHGDGVLTMAKKKSEHFVLLVSA